MQSELALLVREFVRRTPDAYQDFRIPDPAPRPRRPKRGSLLAHLFTLRAWRALPIH